MPRSLGKMCIRDRTLTGLSMQKRLNFEMSVKMLMRSLQDRERVEKIQGLLNELLSFLEDELSVVTGAYQDLLTLDDVLENDLILFVSLNSNRNQRAVEALGKILLQNIQLMVGKRYSQTTASRSKDEPMLSVILDEFAPFAYPGFCLLYTSAGESQGLGTGDEHHRLKWHRLRSGSLPVLPAGGCRCLCGGNRRPAGKGSATENHQRVRLVRRSATRVSRRADRQS